MATDTQPGIIADCRISLLKDCPHCRRWFALQLIEQQPDEVFGKLRVYRCKRCDRITKLASRKPDRCV